MHKRYTRWLVPVLLIFTLSIYIAWPTLEKVSITIPWPSYDSGEGFTAKEVELGFAATINQGLDLQGGLQVLLEADLPEGENLGTDELNRSLDVAKTIIEKRVNGLGVTEPVVQRQGNTRISVELPGVEDVQQAVDLIKQTGLLEFVDAGANPFAEGLTIVTDQSSGLEAGEIAPDGVNLVYHTVMSGIHLREAGAVLNPTTNNYEVTFQLTSEGGQIFADHTRENVGRYLAIVLDGQVVSSPVINSAITGGSGTISGRFTPEEANSLATLLNYGSLPVPLKIVESRTIGPTLGQDSVEKSLVAGVIGLITVILFMVLVYRLPGIVAVLALLMYTSMTFAVFKMIPGFTLTLPGIAGFILSIGVAVDANILIFERMKEELRDGLTVASAIERGFQHAWSSIRDSNISTMITCFILIWFGSQFGASIVQGFALTLLIGVGVSLLTAITATRVFLMAILARVDLETRRNWFGV